MTLKLYSFLTYSYRLVPTWYELMLLLVEVLSQYLLSATVRIIL